MSFDIDTVNVTHPSRLETRQGTVYKKTTGTYFVHLDGRSVTCTISNKLRKELIFPIADPTWFRRRVISVEDINKGKHTTRHLEMFSLRGGGSVVDTPGIREFGLWDQQRGATDIALFFREMRSLVGKCQFGVDCGHASEPGCAIKQAVKQGHISPRRYESYMKMAGG